MQRLAQFDVSRQFISRPAKITSQIMFGGFCAAAMIGLRTLFDIWAPTSGPFALVYPTLLLATLYGHWRAGITAMIVSFFWAWYFILPATGSLAFVDPTDPQRVILNALCCLVVIIFAEGFRKAASITVEQIRESADRRLMLLAELEHRTKNNFALVASMLEIQKGRLTDEALHGPLDDAVGRVRTFADAYSNLDLEHAEETTVAMKPYLELLLDRIERAAIPKNVSLFREIENLIVPRDTAAAIGLYLNEAISNALKYAFPSGTAGAIGVYFNVDGAHWHLSVEDDGVGEAAIKDGAGGLGSKLMTAFASQAQAEHDARPTAKGFRAELTARNADFRESIGN
ncbi:sensor histidine kinase [Altererythrobacter arenosus]|uniref:histidine kinase n=1 Tax=Altererythrobacter arenosus TaxID=3032592 RepID=A0ABY8FX11_9SPHN|nr:sensor histidine kinase [Altererythrobacter sp. CAU 1644]WFL77781.1 sensor histidine kinase [Altererythrobacter sp. CAU 1644]